MKENNGGKCGRNLLRYKESIFMSEVYKKPVMDVSGRWAMAGAMVLRQPPLRNREKSNMAADSASGEACFLLYRYRSSHCVLTGHMGEGAPGVSFIKALIPLHLFSSQRPHLLAPFHWRLGFNT